MTCHSFEVPFVRGKGRVRFARAMGRTYTPDATAEAMQLIRQEWGDRPCAPAGVPVTVRIVTMRPIPKSRPKKIVAEPDVYKPDADNVAKLVLDALTGVAYEDDAQVVRVCVTKARRRRGVDEHMTITIRRPDWGDR